jgi:hypothetical protein
MAEAIDNSGLLMVRLVTPEQVLLDATAVSVELPSSSGYLEALYGAAPLLSELGAGEVRLHGGSAGEQTFFVAWGFVEVLPERVTILAEVRCIRMRLTCLQRKPIWLMRISSGTKPATMQRSTKRPMRTFASRKRRSPAARASLRRLV